MSATMKRMRDQLESDRGKIGYLFLWLLGAPVGFLILLWVLLGSNIFGPG